MRDLDDDSWVGRFFNQSTPRVITWAFAIAVGSTLLHFLFGKPWLEQFGLGLSLIGALALLIFQEIDSHEMKKEVVILARMVEQLMDKSTIDQTKRGVAVRLTNRNLNSFEYVFKSLALSCMVVGTLYTWK